MADGRDMPKVVFDDSEQMKVAKSYAKYIEAKNFMRSVQARKMLIRKRLIFGACCSIVIGAYGFTMFKVKQEAFLDDFDEPPREIQDREMAMRLPSMPTVGSLLRVYKVNALKQLSQNFLLQPKLIDKFVKAAGPLRNSLVCEIGPGPGGITRSILKQSPKYLLLVEKDERFKPMLESLEEATRDHVQVETVYADILDFDLVKFFSDSYRKDWQDKPPNIHLMGNLPFDVSTILLIRWLEDISLRRNVWSLGRVQMTLTFQKEVAERIVAPILTKTRCRLSVICQNYCSVSHKFSMTGKSFVPKPDVDVGVVTLVPLVKPVIPHPFGIIEKVVRTIFNCRQKYISFGVKNLFPLSLRNEMSAELFVKAELDPTLRSFQVSVEEYGRIIGAYREICDRHPPLYNYDYRDNRESRESAWREEAVSDGENEVAGEKLAN